MDPAVRDDRARRQLGRVREVLELADDVERPPFYLFVDAPDVLAHHAEDNQLHTADERRDDDDRRPARHVVDARELDDQAPDRKGEAHERDEESEVQGDAQRSSGEADHAGGCKTEHLPKGVLRLAGEALVTPVEDARLAQPDPAEHAADEAVALAHL